jgi:hypothetical protein
MSKIDGYYVDMTGKVIEVQAIHTTNPRIVDLTEHNLGLVVVDQQFFEDETDAKEQAKFNAEDTIAQCEELLAELDKPKKKAKVPEGDSKRGWSLGRKSAKADPLGPPEYGVGKYVRNKKSGGEYKIIGFRDDEEVLYILQGRGGTVRLNREALDRQYEVVE